MRHCLHMSGLTKAGRDTLSRGSNMCEMIRTSDEGLESWSVVLTSCVKHRTDPLSISSAYIFCINGLYLTMERSTAFKLLMTISVSLTSQGEVVSKFSFLWFLYNNFEYQTYRAVVFTCAALSPPRGDRWMWHPEGKSVMFCLAGQQIEVWERSEGGVFDATTKSHTHTYSHTSTFWSLCSCEDPRWHNAFLIPLW